MAENKLNVMALMSPQMRAAVEKSTELAAGAYDTDATLDQMRAAYNTERRFWNEGGPVMASSVDMKLACDQGDVDVRVHTPHGAPETGPAIVFIHGGGFVLGNLDTHDRIMRALAEESGMRVLGVDYTLSPEAKFPTALLQCATVVQWAHTQGASHGIDQDRLVFAGDSGGAQLSLATYLYLSRELGDASFVAALVLYYGLYGLRDSASRRTLGGSWDGLTEADLTYYMDAYLERPEDAESPYVDCLSADLKDLPPCYVAAAELDPLLDDSTALATMLRAHDRPYIYEVFPGVIHGFLHNSRLVDQAGQALKNGARFARDASTHSHTTPSHN